MQKYQHFTFLVNLLFSFLKLFLIVLLLMSLFRGYLFLNYGSSSGYEIVELFKTFWLGIRLDASILAYLYSAAVLLVVLVWILHLKFLHKYLYPFFRVYFIIILTALSVVTFSDLAYFSFFGEHSTLMIFGVFDDDTQALIHTAFANYNIPLVVIGLILYFSFLYYIIFKTIKRKGNITLEWKLPQQAIFFLAIIAITAFLGRGSIGLFPLAKDVPDVSADTFINKLPQTSGYALLNSYEQYVKSKSGNYDLIKQVGYKGKIAEAFKVHTQKEVIDTKNLLNNIRYKTQKNETLEKNPPNVVVVMGESFGMPLLDYQSESFNIMGRIKKHFDNDVLFKRFISSSNGTVVSLESLLLNITARPKSTSFAQSEYINTSFTQASAKVYKDAGYETTFVYGGDLSWRNVGSFMLRQGFDNVAGKAAVAAALEKNEEDISHVWGVFDQYLYKYIEQKLKNSKKPQFIFALTTNNHPPYIVPKDYVSNKLEISNDLKAHITGDLHLAKLRFKDYAYAVDMMGAFLDDVKSSKLAKNTVVAITADNNTVEGIMKYDEHYTQTKRVPFHLYMPTYLKPKEKIDMMVPSSHKDIFPTLYNLTLSDREYTAIGTNLLDNTKLHCGFNDEDVLMASDGGFKRTDAKTEAQKRCEKYYNASLAVTEYLIKSQKK